MCLLFPHQLRTCSTLFRFFIQNVPFISSEAKEIELYPEFSYQMNIFPVPDKKLEELYSTFHTSFVLIASSPQDLWFLIKCVVECLLSLRFMVHY